MEKDVIFNRAKELCLRVIRMAVHLPETFVSEFIIEQLTRASAFIGIHYNASCRADSMAEAIEKLKLAIEDAHELLFWFEIIEGSEMIKSERLVALKQETGELILLYEAELKLFAVPKSRKKG